MKFELHYFKEIERKKEAIYYIVQEEHFTTAISIYFLYHPLTCVCLNVHIIVAIFAVNQY